MTAVTKIITIEVANEKGARVYIGAYSDEITAQRVRERIDLLAPEGFKMVEIAKK